MRKRFMTVLGVWTILIVLLRAGIASAVTLPSESLTYDNAGNLIFRLNSTPGEGVWGGTAYEYLPGVMNQGKDAARSGSALCLEGLAAETHYNAAGRMVSRREYTYENGTLTGYTERDASGKVTGWASYGMGTEGERITGIFDAANRKQKEILQWRDGSRRERIFGPDGSTLAEFAYDATGRLYVSIRWMEGAGALTHSYDVNGNRIN